MKGTTCQFSDQQRSITVWLISRHILFFAFSFHWVRSNHASKSNRLYSKHGFNGVFCGPIFGHKSQLHSQAATVFMTFTQTDPSAVPFLGHSQQAFQSDYSVDIYFQSRSCCPQSIRIQFFVALIVNCRHQVTGFFIAVSFLT